MAVRVGCWRHWVQQGPCGGFGRRAWGSGGGHGGGVWLGDELRNVDVSGQKVLNGGKQGVGHFDRVSGDIFGRELRGVIGETA